MDFFFVCIRDKQRVFLDVGQSAKVQTVQEMLRSLLDLHEKPRLMKPVEIPGAKDGFVSYLRQLPHLNFRADFQNIKWENMDPGKLLSDYKYTKENAMAHNPAPLAFLLPEDKVSFLH